MLASKARISWQSLIRLLRDIYSLSNLKVPVKDAAVMSCDVLLGGVIKMFIFSTMRAEDPPPPSTRLTLEQHMSKD